MEEAPRYKLAACCSEQAHSTQTLVPSSMQLQVSRTSLILLNASICASSEARLAPVVSTLRCVAPRERQARAVVAHFSSPPHSRRTPDCASIPTASLGLPAALV